MLWQYKISLSKSEVDKIAVNAQPTFIHEFIIKNSVIIETGRMNDIM